MKKSKKRGRRARQEGKRYNGVYRRGGAFVAYVAVNRKQVHIGSYQSEANAAWVADFARYLMWGCDYSLWPATPNGRRPNPPNFPPSLKNNAQWMEWAKAEVQVICGLLQRKLLTGFEQDARLAEYKKATKQEKS